MKRTLEREENSKFFKDQNGYHLMVRKWAQRCLLVETATPEDKEKVALRAIHYLVYAILRGRDYTKGFAFSEEEKIQAVDVGARAIPDHARQILFQLKSLERNIARNLYTVWNKECLAQIFEPFGDILVDDVLKRIVSHLPLDINNASAPYGDEAVEA